MGSEMCIRDRGGGGDANIPKSAILHTLLPEGDKIPKLLYTLLP